MKKGKVTGKIIFLIILVGIIVGNNAYALPSESFTQNDQPIIILAIDKAESRELFECKLPSVRRLLLESSCGLLNIRTGIGYSNTESGYLSIGSGNRSIAPPNGVGAIKPDEILSPDLAGFFWNWVQGRKPIKTNLVIPEIGWVLNQAEIKDLMVEPGVLGYTFRSNGWNTSLIGDQDTIMGTSRPGGYTVMDQDGLIDGGLVGRRIRREDYSFPYRYRFNPEKVLAEVEKLLKPRNIILIEFGDFARLDRLREVMLAEQYSRLKQESWEYLDYFLKELSQKRSIVEYRLLLISPSLSREGISNRSMLAPIVINGTGYSRGLLTSGTTNWEGLVANIDILPTLVNMAGLPAKNVFTGRAIRLLAIDDHLQKLLELNVKINKINSSQRSLLDWYLWIISIGWVAVTLSIVLKKRLGNWILLLGVVIVPLAMLILPLLPVFLWEESGILLTSVVLVILIVRFKTTNQRYFILSLALWGGLILDQITGWNLIRFSALGYSAVGGSRYYGIGNEYMGVFLAVSLLLAHLSYQTLRRKWPSLTILGISALTLGWPQLGINFGGTLAALVGFSFYGANLYGMDWRNRKTLAVFGGLILIVLLIGWWDSLRGPDLQTHLGRFFQLLIDLNISETWRIFYRKAAMNIKLFIFSPWARTILLALGIDCVFKCLIKERMIAPGDGLVWKGILVSGITALIINDSGVIALGTCLAYGYTYFLSRFEERNFLGEKLRDQVD